MMEPLIVPDTIVSHSSNPATHSAKVGAESASVINTDQQDVARVMYSLQAERIKLPCVDQATFRQVLGCFASGVTVVTTQDEGICHGSTVSAFCALSLDPPLILICIDQHSLTHTLIAKTQVFAVNILAEDGEGFSRHFATRNTDKFTGIAYQSGQIGVPLLEDALATIECRLMNQFPGGDHTIFIGEVISANSSDRYDPLVYYRKGYRRLL